MWSNNRRSLALVLDLSRGLTELKTPSVVVTVGRHNWLTGEDTELTCKVRLADLKEAVDQIIDCDKKWRAEREETQ